MRGLGTDLNDARDEEAALADVDLNDREGGICGCVFRGFVDKCLF
jgi:hypothetical protein